MSNQRKQGPLAPEGREEGQNKRRLSSSPNSTIRKQGDTWLRHVPPSMREEGWLQGWGHGPRATENSSQALKPSGVCPVGISALLGFGDSPFLSFCPCCNENVCHGDPGPDPPVYLGADDLSSSFTSSQMETLLPPEGFYLESHPDLIQMRQMMRFGSFEQVRYR